MSRGHARGFTLLEIAITMTILGIVLTIVYGVFAQTVAGKELAESRAEETAGARSAIMRIARDLESARPAPGSSAPPAGTPAPSATPTPNARAGAFDPRRGIFLGRLRSEQGVLLDDLAFTTLLRRPTAATFAGIDLGIVHYFLAPPADDSTTLSLYRETIFALAGGRFDPDTPDLGSSTRILDGVTGLAFRFYDGDEWLQEWDSTDARNYATAPLAVEITLTVANDQGLTERYMTAVDVALARPMKSPPVVQSLPTPEPE